MTISRRGLLLGILSTGVTPAIVSSSNIMRINSGIINVPPSNLLLINEIFYPTVTVSGNVADSTHIDILYNEEALNKFIQEFSLEYNRQQMLRVLNSPLNN